MKHFPLVVSRPHNNVTKQNIDDSERMKSQFLSLLYILLSPSCSNRSTVRSENVPCYCFGKQWLHTSGTDHSM